MFRRHKLSSQSALFHKGSFGSHTVFGKRIAFYRVTKEIERDTMKVYEIQLNCTRHDNDIVLTTLDFQNQTRFRTDTRLKNGIIQRFWETSLTGLDKTLKGQRHSISKRDWNNKQESISKRGILEQKSSNYET